MCGSIKMKMIEQVQVTGQTETANISRVKIKVVARDAGLHRLAHYTPRLKALILDGSCVDSLRDLGSSLKALETLSVVRCSLKSLDGVSGFRSLSTLIARDNSIKNPSPCSLIHKLARLDLANNEIDDPASFAFLQNCRHLRILDVAGNLFDNYRNTIISLVPQIRILDGEDIKEIEVGLRFTEGDESCEIVSDLTSEDEDLILFSEDEDDTSLSVMKSNEKMSWLNNKYQTIKSTEESRSHEMGAGDVEGNNLLTKKEFEKIISKDDKKHEEERNLDPSSSSIYLITHEFHRLSMLDLNATNIGSVDVNNLKVSMSDWYSKDRENPMPSEIKVTTWQNMPYSGLRRNEKGEYEGTGYAFELLKLIQSKLNFTYTIVPPKTPVLGNKYVGVMKQLYGKDVDLAVAFIPVLANFQKFCSFSGTLDEVEITFMMERPSESAIGSGLLAPFNNTVWICILAALIIVGPVIYVLIYIRSRISKRGHPEGYPLSTCIWFTYGALLKQGSTVTPVTDSARLLFATWWIFITILTSFYTANLTAFLTLSEFTLPYTSLMDIMNRHPKWVAFQDHNVQNILTMTPDQDEQLRPLKKSIANHYGSYITSYNDQYKNVDFEIVRKTVYTKPPTLFLGEKYFFEDLIFDDYRNKTLERWAESKRCTLVMLPENLFVNTRAFAYPRNSPIAEHIDRHLRNLVETGIVKHLKKESLPAVQYCPLNLKSTERRLRNADLTMTYYCVGVGFALATVVFIGEMIHRLLQLRKGFSCGNCCGRVCCRSKIKSAVLPIYKQEGIRNFPKHKSSPMKGSPYNNQMGEQQEINGRDYWVIREHDGDRRLVPIRSPSALLFQYASYLDAPNSMIDIPKL